MVIDTVVLPWQVIRALWLGEPIDESGFGNCWACEAGANAMPVSTLAAALNKTSLRAVSDCVLCAMGRDTPQR
jgi:hypothetical protein